MKLSNRQRISIAVTLLMLVAWCAVILLLGNFTRLGGYGWLSFLSVPVCAGVTLLCAAIYKPVRNDVSAIAVPFVFSELLLLLVAVINAIYIFIGSVHIGAFVVAANILLLTAYLVVVIFGNTHLWNLSSRTERVEQASALSTNASRALGSIASQADDPDVHRSLVRLKEMVDYSTNTSFAADEASTLLAKLDALKDAVSKKDDPERVQGLISELTTLWKQRNASL